MKPEVWKRRGDWEMTDGQGVRWGIRMEQRARSGGLERQTKRRNRGKRVDVPMVQKPPSKVVATAYEEGALTWAPALGAQRVRVGAIWGEGRNRKPPEGWEMGAVRGGN